jgi:hypothetical protein
VALPGWFESALLTADLWAADRHDPDRSYVPPVYISELYYVICLLTALSREYRGQPAIVELLL